MEEKKKELCLLDITRRLLETVERVMATAKLKNTVVIIHMDVNDVHRRQGTHMKW